jgi:hypothetical protein
MRRNHDGVRGADLEPHAASQRADVWKMYDKRFADIYYRTLTLAEYLDPKRQAVDLSAEEERSALLTRISIMARKGLWNHVVSDLELLSEYSEIPLTGEQKILCQRSMAYISSSTFLDLARDPGLLRSIKGRTCTGFKLEVKTEFLRGLIYQLLREARAKNMSMFARTLYVFCALADSRSFLGLRRV